MWRNRFATARHTRANGTARAVAHPERPWTLTLRPTPWAVGRYSTVRYVRVPRATELERSEKTFRSLCRRRFAVLVRSSLGRRRWEERALRWSTTQPLTCQGAGAVEPPPTTRGRTACNYSLQVVPPPLPWVECAWEGGRFDPHYRSQLCSSSQTTRPCLRDARPAVAVRPRPIWMSTAFTTRCDRKLCAPHVASTLHGVNEPPIMPSSSGTGESCTGHSISV